MDKPRYAAMADWIDVKVEFIMMRLGIGGIAMVVAALLASYVIPARFAGFFANVGFAAAMLAAALMCIGMPAASALRNFVSPFLDGGSRKERRIAIVRMVLVTGIIADFFWMALYMTPQNADAIIIPYMVIAMFCGISLTLPGATEWLVGAGRQKR